MTTFTERLRLEPVTTEHGAELHRLHLDPAVAEWWDGPYSRAQADAQAATFAAGWQHDGVSKWMAYDRSSGEMIGRGGLSRIHVDGARRLEVGWVLFGRHWGRGYATEIGRAGLTYAFDELDADEVVAFTEPHNTRSRAVMERLGLSYRRDIVHDDMLFVLYGIERPPAR